MKRYKAIAHYYDHEYAASKMLQRDVPFMLSKMPGRKRSVLEIAVGTARAAIPIAQAGHRVVGVDYASDMLDLARHKRDSVGLTEKQLKLIHFDALKLKLRERFDWVCILFNTFLAFPTVESQQNLLRVVHRHLKPAGRFWLDIFHPCLAILSTPRSRGHEPRQFYVPELDRTVLSTTDIDRDASKQMQRVRFNYQWFDKFGKSKTDTLQFQMTWVYPRELVLLLNANGFEIEKLYGNHDGSPLSDDSPRMIACCRKRR